jgi:XTP/dITP diphosphohydrolase
VTDRLFLIATSPRLPAGLLSWNCWQVLRSAPVYAGGDGAQVSAVRSSGVDVTLLAGDPPAQARTFRDKARDGGSAAWLAGPDGDPLLAREVGNLVAREGGAELEVVYGSWDPPGAGLLGAVEVMDRLRSPGGCPWDAEQTHASLMPYLIEEAYEAYTALEEGDLAALQEELGDVLLQVLFHARLAEELPEDERWSIDDVAAGLVAKLVRRHPHVFADTTVSGSAEVNANWDTIKMAEKERTSVTDGVPLNQPALTLAAMLLRRAEKAGVAVPLPGGTGDRLGARLLALVIEGRRAGLDAEVELRATARELRDRILAAEGA